MRTLAIDSATQACSVALFDRRALTQGTFEILGRGHAERLVPMISGLTARGKAQRIAVSLGPGSFTGVRIGLATARALALAWQAETVGYPTLALVAAMARNEAGDQAVTVAMTGGHGEWFVQDFDRQGAAAGPLASMTPADAVERSRCTLVAGSEAEALVAARGTGTALPLLPDARQFHLLAESAYCEALTPLYGRPPDARLPGNAA